MKSCVFLFSQAPPPPACPLAVVKVTSHLLLFGLLQTREWPRGAWKVFSLHRKHTTQVKKKKKKRGDFQSSFSCEGRVRSRSSEDESEHEIKNFSKITVVRNLRAAALDRTVNHGNFHTLICSSKCFLFFFAVIACSNFNVVLVLVDPRNKAALSIQCTPQLVGMEHAVL